MKLGSRICLIALAALMGVTITGCGQLGDTEPLPTEQTTRPDGWSEETHGADAAPDYDVVFPQDKVSVMEITITPEDWVAMQANLTELLGPRDSESQGGRPRVRPDAGGVVPGQVPPEGGVAPQAPGVPGWIDMTSENPIWVPATIECNGLTWQDVGLRYKGSSSLRSGWSSGSAKLPLKLDFDQFEDEYPEIENQRFYGFKQLSFSNSFADATYMRDVLAADILADAGLVAAETAYYEVILDYGDGPVNLGLYVAIEVIDDTVIERYFDGDSGNIYEADGPGASLAENAHNQLSSSFVKENNEDEADWSDVEGLYNALHSETRVSEPVEWRAGIESVFDVDGFLKWLAAAAALQHWDTYGQMSHNFYLYDDPDTGLLNWISWDHNQVLAGGSMGDVREDRVPGGTDRTVSLGREEVGADWPLIRFLLDDDVYSDRYTEYVKDIVDGAFNPEVLEQQCRALADLITPYAAKESGAAAFDAAVQELIDRIYQRHEAATAFLDAEAGS